MNNKTQFIQIRVTKELKDKAKKLAKIKGFNLSNYVKYLILKDYEKKDTS